MRRLPLARLCRRWGPRRCGAVKDICVLGRVGRGRPVVFRPPLPRSSGAIRPPPRPAGPRLPLRASAEWPTHAQRGRHFARPVWCCDGCCCGPRKNGPLALAPRGNLPRGAQISVRLVSSRRVNRQAAALSARVRPRRSGGITPPSCHKGGGPFWLRASAKAAAELAAPLALWPAARSGLRPAAKARRALGPPRCRRAAARAHTQRGPCAGKPLAPPLRGGRLWPREARGL